MPFGEETDPQLPAVHLTYDEADSTADGVEPDYLPKMSGVKLRILSVVRGRDLDL